MSSFQRWLVANFGRQLVPVAVGSLVTLLVEHGLIGPEGAQSLSAGLSALLNGLLSLFGG